MTRMKLCTMYRRLVMFIFFRTDTFMKLYFLYGLQIIAAPPPLYNTN